MQTPQCAFSSFNVILLVFGCIVFGVYIIIFIFLCIFVVNIWNAYHIGDSCGHHPCRSNPPPRILRLPQILLLQRRKCPVFQKMMCPISYKVGCHVGAMDVGSMWFGRHTYALFMKIASAFMWRMRVGLRHLPRCVIENLGYYFITLSDGVYYVMS